ncbi:helix-turn-helix domain-containing protein [Polyangium spumosum]|uniref:Helix-turn-helix domain-containing protein n=1 Tax=Polyangium spumosum TaxID=889282 RepID=A0A6N7PWK5_9BACT|nr:helix-turn-helix domain-containing protein [Polyangium spumosum]
MPTSIEPFYAEVGRRLHALRTAAGMTQDALGARLQPPMTRASIANIETGKQRLLAKTLVDLAEALGKDVTALLPQKAPVAKQASTPIRAELEKELKLPQEDFERLMAQIDDQPRRGQ